MSYFLTSSNITRIGFSMLKISKLFTGVEWDSSVTSQCILGGTL